MIASSASDGACPAVALGGLWSWLRQSFATTCWRWRPRRHSHGGTGAESAHRPRRAALASSWSW